MSTVSSLALRQTRTTLRRNQNAVRYESKRLSLGPISNTLVLALILSLMGLLYLTQITKTSTFGYEVNQLEERKTALVEEQQSREVEAARLQALETIQTSEVAQNLTDPVAVEFVQ